MPINPNDLEYKTGPMSIEEYGWMCEMQEHQPESIEAHGMSVNLHTSGAVRAMVSLMASRTNASREDLKKMVLASMAPILAKINESMGGDTLDKMWGSGDKE